MIYRTLFIISFLIIEAIFCSQAFCSDSFISSLNKYELSSIDLKRKYPERYQALYNKVRKTISKEELDSIMSRKIGIELDKDYDDKLMFIVSPQSAKIQRKQHKDWVPILVNDKTLKQGKQFFYEYEKTLKAAYEQTGVLPGDIIAVLNWESHLGKYRGTFRIFNIFVGQYFYIDEYERKLYQQGAYNKKDAMSRASALQRVVKLKKRGLDNLSQLLIQAKTKDFDPFKVKGSWAGAIGIPQFMPASMRFAKDGDGDGTIDLNTMPDAIMSVANYLKFHSYHSKGKKYAFMGYNPEEMYVRGVTLYSQKIEDMGVKPFSDWVYKY